MIIIFLLIPFSTSSAANNNDMENNDMLLLKAGHLNTADSIESQNKVLSMSSVLSEEKPDYYIVQFSGLVKEEWKKNVTSTGAELYNYVPNNAFIVKMNTSVKIQVQELEVVKWIGEYKSSYKYDPETIVNSGTETGFKSLGSEEIQEYYVSLFSEDEYVEVVKSLEDLGIKVISGSGKIIRIQASADQIGYISKITGISWIEEYVQPTINNDIASGIITTDIVHDTYDLNGSGQVVAVADTGLDTGLNDNSMHADLRGRVLNITDTHDGDPADYAGHGTHVAGSVLGNGSLSDGQYSGMAPEAELVFQSLGDSSDYLYPPDNLNDLFQAAYDKGARIHTNSWGSSQNGVYTEYSQQIDQFMWEHQDMLILFSAGNSGVDSNRDGVIDEDSLGSPGTAKNCLTVGASENERGNTFSIPPYTTWGGAWSDNYPLLPIFGDYMANNSNGIAAFSSRGPTNDGRIKPDVVAPGTFIASTRSSVSSGTGWGTVSGNSNYLYMGGTSMSTPITAGAAALVREYYTDVENLSSPSAALLKATIINGACNITPGQYGTGDFQEIDRRPDYSQGWGRIDIENSIYPQSPVVMEYYDYVFLNSSESWNVSYDILYTSEPVRLTLVWTDHPPADISGPALVNNLDLILEAPDDTYYGNGAPDAVNNVEGIELLEPVAGTYTITVNGTNIPQGPQNFSLVLSYGELSNIYMYPEHNSYKTNASTEVYMNLTHVDGINASSIDMKIDGSSVVPSLEAISGGYKIENLTSQPYSEGFHNVSVSALTDLGEELNYGWRFYVSVADNIIAVQNPLDNSVIQDNNVFINASSTKWCDFWYNIDNGVNSTTQSGYTLNTSTEISEGSYNITVFAEDISGIINSTTVNFTVFKESAEIDSPDSGSIYYLPDSSFTLNGTVGTATNVSIYVNGALTNYSESVSNGIFNVSNIPISNGTNTINVSAMYNNSLRDYFAENTTIYLSLGQTVDTASRDQITVNVPGIDANVSNPVFNFNVSGTSSNPGNISAAEVRGTEPGNGSSLSGTVLDIRVYNESDPDYSYQFGRNVSLTLGYDPYLVNSTTKLTVAWYDPDEGVWVPYRSTVNSTSNTVTTNITHLSIYAPMEDNTEPVINNVTNSSTSSTVTLEWNSSNDTDHVEVWKSGLLLGNYSGYEMTDIGLSASTIYNYSLRAVDYVGNVGGWYNTSVKTSAAISTTSISSSSGGGGGGGGGGSTGEDFDNIAFKDVLSVYAGKDDLVDFDFTKEHNDIDYVRYTSLKNAGKITVTIEMLKNTSALVNEPVSGSVYKNMNIWVGKTGYATESNIQNPVIGFIVSKEWVDDTDVNISTIVLNRYSENVWTTLETELTGEDADYYYFEASTPGFSPFAVSADIPTTSTIEKGTINDQVEAGSSNDSGDEEPVVYENNEDIETDKSTPAISGLITLLILAVASVLIRKQQN
ncbi:PGF-pre-PGF domain-containing protein [Methanolobus bombayensis]|uniref:PGF-pre-PGF domain-containing protein n=1 Tax=Methanolobus bombayensis TaxID=38023 RepID=UPI001AE30021|nr:PGF-pre-PGF domain-containing protein [Methanolobus bombayensis]